MKQSTKRVLRLAVGGAMASGCLYSAARAATQTWNSTSSSDWLTAANWNSAVPGIGDLALFGSVAPPSNTININSAVELNAIVDSTPASDKNLTFNLVGNLTLDGQSVTVNEAGSNFTQSNTVLADVSASSTATQTLTITGANVVLNTPTNYMLVSQGGNTKNVFQTLTINSNITDGAGGPASLTLLGQGTGSVDGGGVNFGGSNTFSGGLTLGTPDIGGVQTNQGVQLTINAPTNLPATGNVTVNENSQILLENPGTYGSATQTITLNGIGINKNISGALRTSAVGLYDILSNVTIGSSDSTDASNGQVVVSPTSEASKVIQISGVYGGSGSLQKQGSGAWEYSNPNNTNTGGTQIGNGIIVVDAGSSAGAGYLNMDQTSTNYTVADFDNLTQNIGNLSSAFTTVTPGQGGGFGSTTNQQAVFLNGTTQVFINSGANAGTFSATGSGSGTTLNITQTGSTSFGYGADTTYTAVIQGPGSIVLTNSSTASGTLTFTGPNLYTGGTIVNGGTLNLANRSTDSLEGSNSATGSGNVTVNSGGTLTSGDGAQIFAQGTPITSTSGTMSGTLIVNSGGTVIPGGNNLVGTLNVGALTAHTGSIFDFNLVGGTTASASQILDAGALTLDNGGTETVNVLGSNLAYGTYTLATFGSLTNSGTSFTLGSDPAGTDRNYSLTTNSNSLILNIVYTGGTWNWSVGGGNPAVDGGGNWAAGSTNFFTTNPSGTQVAYSNSSTNPVIFGNGGNGGTVTLSGPVNVGGALIFQNVNTPYTIGAPGGTNSLTLSGGIAAAASAAINAPIVLQGSQTFSASAGTTLDITDGISQTGGAAALTIGNQGTVDITGTSTYTGGTTISQGVLEISTSSLPATNGVSIATAGSLVFDQTANGSYSGLISGTGAVTIDGSTGTTLTLSNTSNSYSGGTVIAGGILSVNNIAELGGTAPGSITLGGGTLLAGSTLSFPDNASQLFTLTSGTTSTINTNGFNVTIAQEITGSGNLTKAGTGTLVLSNLFSTKFIGNLAVSGGTISLAPTNDPSWGFSADPGGNTINGNVTIAQPMELRLWGGVFSGTGTLNFVPNNLLMDTKATTTIGTNILLNDNTTALSNYTLQIGSAAGAPLTISGSITGNGAVDFTSASADIYLSGTSTYTGGTTIDNSTGAEVQVDANNALPDTPVHITHSGVLDLYGVNQTIESLDAGPNATSALVINEASGPSSLVILGNATDVTTYNGALTDGGTTSGFLNLTLAAGNAGTLTLTNSNSYSGGTTLNGGTLSVSADDNLGLDSGGGGGALTLGGGELAVTTGFSSSRPITINPGASTIDVANGNTLSFNPTALTWANGNLNVVDTGQLVLAPQSGAAVSVTPTSVLNVAANSTVLVNGSVDPFTDSSNSSHHVAIVNNGSFTVADVNSSIAGITGAGALTVGDGAHPNTLQLATGSGGSSQALLVINAGSTLDITNNHLIIDYGSNPDPKAAILGYLSSGAAGGLWNGTGITSSTAAANSKYGVAFADGADGVDTNLSSGQIEIAYAQYGDITLSGLVNAQDFSILSSNFGKVVTGGWEDGDFTYSGTVNAEDFHLLTENFGQTETGEDASIAVSDWAAVDAFAAANNLTITPSSVPEPASMAILAIVGVGLLSRRRRCKSIACA